MTEGDDEWYLRERAGTIRCGRLDETRLRNLYFDAEYPGSSILTGRPPKFANNVIRPEEIVSLVREVMCARESEAHARKFEDRVRRFEARAHLIPIAQSDDRFGQQGPGVKSLQNAHIGCYPVLATGRNAWHGRVGYDRCHP